MDSAESLTCVIMNCAESLACVHVDSAESLAGVGAGSAESLPCWKLPKLSSNSLLCVRFC